MGDQEVPRVNGQCPACGADDPGGARLSDLADVLRSGRGCVVDGLGRFAVYRQTGKPNLIQFYADPCLTEAVQPPPPHGDLIEAQHHEAHAAEARFNADLAKGNLC